MTHIDFGARIKFINLKGAGPSEELAKKSQQGINLDDEMKAPIEQLMCIWLELAVSQLRISTIATEALLRALRQDAAERYDRMPLPNTSDAVVAASDAIYDELIRGCDLGFQIFLRTNFPPDRIMLIARAALVAAASTQIKCNDLSNLHEHLNTGKC